VSSFILFVRIALRNALAYWRQSLAAIISVVAGFVAFVIFEGYLQDIYHTYTNFNERLEMYGDAIIEQKGAYEVDGRSDPWLFALNHSDQELIQTFLQKNRLQIEATSRFLNVSGSVDTSNTSLVFQGIAYEAKAAAELRGSWRWDTYWGKPIHVSQRPKQQMVVGMRLAQKLGCLPDQINGLDRYFLDLKRHPQYRPFACENEEFQLTAMTEKGQINAIDLSVSGIQDKGFLELDSRYVVLPLEAAQRLFNTDKVSYISVKFKPGAQKNKLIDDFNQFVQGVNPNIHMIPWTQHFFGTLYNKTINLLDVIRNFLISIIVFVGSMSVFNTLVKLVKERTQEIGMLRSLGFRPKQIRQLFLMEAVFLSWLGCCLGSAIALSLSLFLNKIEFTYPSGQFSYESPFLILISPSSYIYGFILMSGIAIFACWVAVRSPSKDNISHLLLHT
jgi:ABC-type lipoprotein release transport system permease subunit